MRGYEMVTPVDLREGDEILAHGGRFIVREHRISREGVAVNICDFLGDHPTYGPCTIPVSWRKRWNEQGNKLASVSRVISNA